MLCHGLFPTLSATVDEAKEVVTKARMWRWKPDGEVTLRYAQDAQGSPLPLMQDPLHYPHGTKFMAPGEATGKGVAGIPRM
jgi:hypothetical protein